MAPRSKDEIMVRDSIEAKGDEDVEMEGTPPTNGNTQHTTTTSVDTIPQLDGAADGDIKTRSFTRSSNSSTNRDSANGEGEGESNRADEEDAAAPPKKGKRRGRARAPDTPQKRLLTLISSVTQYLTSYKEEGEEAELSGHFQRIPLKATFPDYYAIIGDNNVLAFSSLRKKVMEKKYTKFSEYVSDVARISHNAQIYNRPSSVIFADSLKLREVFQEKLQELVAAGDIQAEEAVLPDFGELPPVEDSPLPAEGDEIEAIEEDKQIQQQQVEEEVEDEEEEDDEEEEESDDSRRRGRKGKRRPIRKDEDDDYGKKRGRPPKVFTPTEARINAILKGLRKPKDRDGNLRVLDFEKLPEKSNKQYYDVIKNPIALDQIKRNAKRKKYHNVDECLADLDIMFSNAKHFNEDGSTIYEDAVELQKEAHRLAEQEKAKPDDSFRDEEGKLPLSAVQHNGEAWKVGDWVHLYNSNDPMKPIVAQIYRVWQDKAGKQWINACWYYRPEQTVHRATKHFHKNEVMKTGQYRDHRVDDIEDRCFVMFHTRYHKGRPRGFPADKSVYICEARYNEQTHVFNRIKTWTSCLPDEVREKDYQMDLYDVPLKVKKELTPIAHLLRPDAKETDPLPKPTTGSKDMPPTVGAVHMRPREPNDTPSPEPTPEPRMVPAVPRMPYVPPQQASTAFQPQPHPGAVPAASAAHPQYFQQPQFAPQQQQRPSYQQHQPTVPPPAVHHHVAPSPHFGVQQHPAYQQQPHFVPSPVSTGHHHHIPNSSHQTPFTHPHASAIPPRMMPPQNSAGPVANANMYNPPKHHEVYTMRDLDAQIPPEVRDRYQTDADGRVLFFTAPPLPRANPRAALGHSVAYLSGLAEHKAERQRKRTERDEQLARDREEQAAREKTVREQREVELGALAGNMLGNWILKAQRDTELLEQQIAPFKADKAAWDAEKAAATNGISGTNGTNGRTHGTADAE